MLCQHLRGPRLDAREHRRVGDLLAHSVGHRDREQLGFIQRDPGLRDLDPLALGFLRQVQMQFLLAQPGDRSGVGGRSRDRRTNSSGARTRDCVYLRGRSTAPVV